MRLLLEAGADPDMSTAGGRPLHVAGHAGHVDMPLAAAADPAARDRRGQCALHAAAVRSSVQPVKAVLYSL